jgi:RHS repeat-associated protein
LVNIKAPKNGYAYIYISNQSNNAVYFDDFKVQVTAGRIIEENHYYPYGLKIATLSAKKLADVYEGVVKNNYLYNGKELLDEDADLGWLDYGFRNYDPQIGRFPQLDPLSWEYPYYTPYQFAGNDPIANVDLDGLEPLNVVSKIKSVLKEGGEHVVSGVRKSGLNIGKWTVSWFKDGVAFSHVFHSTGFLTQRLVSATIHLLSSASNIATSVPFKMRGDLANSFKIPNQQQQAINAYNASSSLLNEAIEKGWHKAEKVNPDDPVLSGWQSWEVNDITGDKRINGLVQAITPVYPEAAAIPFPKLGKLFSWLRSIKFGAGAAKG